ncbi:LapA family protein [Pseudomonas sp. CCI1.2]|uniref:LapA family protein n=1 Tax=Pseudomonas sp. CCI1.2 TaxID=3048614 RepID=UPI002B23420F|nr:LapA family protein [Pseudomonas sp. CCI1.2]MEB0120475.1 LapA family protein [Pseudomonas sp. CCI1.2]
MRNLKRITFVVITLLVVLATVVFMLENQQPVSLVFLGWGGPQTSVAIPIILALLLGMMIGPLLSWVASLSNKPKRAKTV